MLHRWGVITDYMKYLCGNTIDAPIKEMATQPQY